MRIGRHEITISLLVHAVILAGVLYVLWGMYRSHRASRIEGRLRDEIYRCLNERSPESLEKGAGHCQEIIDEASGNIQARLYLATFRYRQGRYSEALKVYEKVSKMRAASSEQAALALAACGAAKFNELSKGKEVTRQACLEAGTFFERALEKDRDLSDAKVGLAIVDMHRKKGKAPQKSIALLTEALEGEHPPGLQAAAQGFNALGVLLTDDRQSVKADAAFLAAKAENPRWTTPEENRRWTALSGFNNPELSLAEREKLIKQYERRTKIYGKKQPLALNALAVGLWQTRLVRTETSYLQTAYPKALEILRKTKSSFPGHPRSYLNLAGLYDHRLFGDPADTIKGGLWSKLGDDLKQVGVAGLSRPMPWRGDKGKVGRNPTTQEREVLTDIRSLASEKIKVLKELLDKASDLPEAIKWRAEYHRFATQELRYVVSVLENDRQGALKDLSKSAKNLQDLRPKSPLALQCRARAWLYQKEYVKALALLQKAKALGDSSDTTQQLIQRMSRPPAFFALRPIYGKGYGKKPLVGLGARVQGPPGTLNLTLTYDQRKLAALQKGTQIMILADENMLTDGVHTLDVLATDVIGNTARRKWTFTLDMAAPVLSLEPLKFVKGPRPKWTVKLIDSGVGVDLKSIAVSFQSVSTKATPIHESLIFNGVFKKDLSNLNIAANDPLKASAFDVSPSVDIKPGVYKLVFSFSDKVGNAKKVVKNLIVQ